MSQSILEQSFKIKKFSSSATKGRDHSFKPFRRPHLPGDQFKQANKQKIIWMRAAFQEAQLKGNENHVLEALVFLVDPVYGHGEPAVGAIQERCAQNGVFIHYETVRDCLKRLQQKGVISIEFRGNKLTNHYRLIGFEYESTSCYEEPLNNTNSSFSPKGREGRKSNLNTKNDCEMQIEPQEYVPIPQEKVRSYIEQMKRMLNANQ